MWNKFKQHITFYNAILILLHAVIPHHHHSVKSTVEGECSHIHAVDNQNLADHVVIDINTNHHHHHGLHVDHEFDIGKCQLKKSKFAIIDISSVSFCNSFNTIFTYQLNATVDNAIRSCNFDEKFLPDFYTNSFCLRGPPALI